MGRLFPQTINSQKELGFLLHKPGCLFRMQPPGNQVSTVALRAAGNTPSGRDKGDINWSAFLGKILANEQARLSFRLATQPTSPRSSSLEQTTSTIGKGEATSALNSPS